MTAAVDLHRTFRASSSRSSGARPRFVTSSRTASATRAPSALGPAAADPTGMEPEQPREQVADQHADQQCGERHRDRPEDRQLHGVDDRSGQDPHHDPGGGHARSRWSRASAAGRGPTTIGSSAARADPDRRWPDRRPVPGPAVAGPVPASPRAPAGPADSRSSSADPRAVASESTACVSGARSRQRIR